MSQRVDFIDVSHWQDQINWTDVAVLNPQLVGVIAKCTEGKSYLDPEYKNNRAGALNNGLAFAPYHYLTQGDGAGQMAWFLNCAQVREGERIVLDYEEMDPEVRLADLEDAVAYLRSECPDLQITIYGASKLTEDCVNGDSSFLEGTSLWAARYSAVNQPVIASPPWECWTAWQFSDDGEVEGIPGGVDVNTFNGTPSACLAWFGERPEPEPVPEPEPEPEPAPVPGEVFVSTLQMANHEVVVTIGGGLVRIYVDGKEWVEA
jgi:lysozyme